MNARTIAWGFICLAFASGLPACAETDPAHAMCEGLQTRARVVDPLADAKSAKDTVTCQEYEAERKRLLPAQTN